MDEASKREKMTFTHGRWLEMKKNSVSLMDEVPK